MVQTLLFTEITKMIIKSSVRMRSVKTDPFICKICINMIKKKGRAVPLQAQRGPEGSSKLKLQDFVTMALDDGKVVSFTHRPPLPPGNTPGTHFC